jgi:uncharacterized low-complexity protein
MAVIMVVVTVVTVVAVMTMVTAAVRHVLTAAEGTAGGTAAEGTAGVGIAGGERRNGNNDRCGESKKCSALEHV